MQKQTGFTFYAKHFIIGILLGLMFLSPTYAQFAVHILSDTSPTTIKQTQDLATQTVLQGAMVKTNEASFIKQVAEYGEQAKRWMDTVSHYSQMINDNAKRFTSLRGILKAAESQLGLSEDTLKALADVGDLIRGAYTLKNQFVALVQSRLAMIESLERRARNGIFDPRADLLDLENYLKNSVGREARRTLITREKIAQTDAVMEKLTRDLQEVRAERAAVEKELADLQKNISKETSLKRGSREAGSDENSGASTTVFDDSRVSVSGDAVQTDTIRIGSLETALRDLKKRESELLDKIRERYESYQVGYDKAYYTAYEWNNTLEAWKQFNDEKIKQIDGLISTSAEQNDLDY